MARAISASVRRKVRSVEEITRLEDSNGVKDLIGLTRSLRIHGSEPMAPYSTVFSRL